MAILAGAKIASASKSVRAGQRSRLRILSSAHKRPKEDSVLPELRLKCTRSIEMESASAEQFTVRFSCWKHLRVHANRNV